MNNLFEENIANRNTAHRLTILFSEEKDIPTQFRNGSKKNNKGNLDTLIRNRFDKKLADWDLTISEILNQMPKEQAWRIINLNPEIESGIQNFTTNKDFLDFTDYFILRRDIHLCSDNELGCLAHLHTAFQKVIENEIKKNKPDFVAIDFEHATRNKGSVCSVGIVTFQNGQIIDEYYSLVQPPNNEYELVNSMKNRISAKDTENAPKFIDIYPEIFKRINNNIVVAHGAFHTDKHCLEQAMDFAGIENDLNINWECTQNICESKLDIACTVCNIPLDHHNALSDATACGILYSRYLNQDLPLERIQVEKISQKQNNNSYNDLFPESLKGDVLQPDFENAINKGNPFYMKKVVISGFESDNKKRIAQELKEFGADVDISVGKKTNYLIAGENVGPSKMKKMKENIAMGIDAKIIDFEEYKNIINNYR